MDSKDYGITNREGFGIFINRKNGDISIGLGYGLQIVTIGHEVIMYFLESLINSNNGNYADNLTPKNSFIDNEDNDKFEKIIFGNKISRLFIGGNHFLFNIENWQLSLKDFSEGFQENNKARNIKELINELSVLINNDNDVKIFFEGINYKGIAEKEISQSIAIRQSRNYINSNNFVS